MIGLPEVNAVAMQRRGTRRTPKKNDKDRLKNSKRLMGKGKPFSSTFFKNPTIRRVIF